MAVARNGSRLYVSDWAGRARARASTRPTSASSPRIARRRAPEPDRPAPEGRPPVRRLRLEQQRRRDRHASAASSPRRSRPPSSRRRPRAARPTPWPSAPTARRSTSPTPTTTAWPSSTSTSPARSQVQGLHPDRLVSDRRGRHARRQEPARRRRQGQPDQAEPDRRRRRRTKADEPDGEGGDAAAVPVHRHHALGRPVDRAGPRREAARGLHRRGLSQLPLLRQAADRRPVRREDGDPDQGRRPVADQARHLHHQGEPHLRPGLRRHRRRATATRAW